MELDFVKGHMGGNRIVLLCGDQVPAGRELAVAVKALGPQYLWAHEAGILYPGTGDAGLKVRIVEPNSNCFISACGGLTQVLGKALVETGLGSRFNIQVREPATKVMLETDAGPTEIEIEVSAGRAARSVTDMRAFVRECYDKGVRAMEVQGVRLMQVGKFLVLNADLARRVHPGADFVNWDGETRRIFAKLHRQFMEITGEREYNFTLYDWNPARGGDLRVVFPHYLPDNYIEPSCGTGSVAAGIAVLACGELARRGFAPGGMINMMLEAGGSIELGGPDTTSLFLDVSGGMVERASFSHSFVEITATGRILLE